jgi:adenine-specific DNA-methyltransferase
MPELIFKGKEYVYNHHLTVPYRPLIPDKSKSIGEADLSGNLIIHGDNLHALKALMPRYAGKVDLIFIDPPYNTGNENWSYNDNVNSPLMKEWLSSNPVNAEDMLRHDKWLCMMWPRLVLLRELLSTNGVLAICIDNNELHRLHATCDELFQESSFLGSIVWRTRNADNRVKSKLSQDHEYILLFSASSEVQGRVISRSDFSNPDGDPRGPYVTDPLTGKATADRRPNLHYTIENEATGDKYVPDPALGWITDPEGFRDLLTDNRISWPVSPETGKPRKKRFLSETAERMPESTFWSDMKGVSGNDALDAIFSGQRVFDFPKPLPVVERVIDLCASKDSLILDSFAGSGTTAHAVMKLNSIDGGSRQFILVEGEDYADTLTAERVRRVIDGYAFVGNQREELLKEKITWSKLQQADTVLKKVEAIKAREGFADGDLADQGTTKKRRFDKIAVKIDDGILTVDGEKRVSERVEGLGGEFTYCTLGEPIDAERLLSGESLPDYASLGAWLFHTATGGTLDATRIDESTSYLGEARDKHVWLIYRPDMAFLKSSDSALTLSFAKGLSAKRKGKGHLVFAAAKFMSNKQLLEHGVEFAALPYGLYREG